MSDPCGYCLAPMNPTEMAVAYDNRLHHKTCYALMRASLDEAAIRYRAALERIAVMTRAAVLDDPLFAWAIARDALKGTE